MVKSKRFTGKSEENMKKLAFLASVGLLVSQVHVHGFPLIPNVGSVLTPRGELDAWESYPKGLLRSRGEHIWSLDPDMSYTVTARKTLKILLFGNEVYLQVVPTGSTVGEIQPAWVFQGREGASLPPNLIPSEEREEEREEE